MSGDKLVNAELFKQLYRAGYRFSEIQQKYFDETDIWVNSLSTFTNWAARLGLEERRHTRTDDLIPWPVRREHRYRYAIMMLRAEAKRRQGKPLTDIEQRRLERWLAWLRENNAVVHYDPDTEQGWWYVPREPSDDDIIRRPPKSQARTRRARR